VPAVGVLRLALIPLLAFAVAAARPDPAAGKVAPCDRVASPRTADAVHRLLERLSPGQTGCLRSGTYVADQFLIRTPRIGLMSFPGERATLRGRLRVNVGGDGAVIRRLNLDGRNPHGWLGVLIYANRVVLRANRITNHHLTSCVFIDRFPGNPPPRGVVIDGNRIHDCGRLPATNQDHGIYVAGARGTVIRNNWIHDNADRGIQLYPDADRTRVTGNVVYGNGQGVIFGGNGDSSSDDNLVKRNVITDSRIRYNIESHWQGPTGTGNVARRNCVRIRRDRYSGSPPLSGIQPDASGFRASRNRVAVPRYVRPAAGNFELRPRSKCSRVTFAADGRRSGARRVRLRGRVAGMLAGAGRRVVLEVRRGGGWKRFASGRVGPRDRFAIRRRVMGGPRTLRLRAKVSGVGRSHAVRVPVRGH